MKITTRFGLNEKLIVITISTIFLVLSSYVYFNLKTFIHIYRESIIKTVFAQAQELKNMVYDVTKLGFALGELKGMNEECGKMVRDIPYATYCFIMDNTGRVYYHNLPEKVGSVYTDSITQKAIKTGEDLVQYIHLDSRENIYDFSIPLKDISGKKIGMIRIGILSNIVDNAVRNERERALILGTLSILISFLIVSILYRLSILKSIRSLMSGITGFGEGKFDTRVVLETKDEFGELAKTFNQMAEELKQTQDQLIQAEKLNVIGRLASGVAHEVRNPLSIILQGLNYLENRIPTKEEDISETLTTLKDNVKRADKIINVLLDFSRATSLDLRPEDVNSILEVSLSLVKTRSKFENIESIMETKKDIPKVLADKNKLEQVFINILLNAVQSMPRGGKIIIRSYDKQLEEVKNGIGRRKEDYFQVGEKVVIVEIEDTGVGIPEENLKKIFDPFFTTKGPTGGAGLGLSVTRNIITMHKGLIDIESQTGKGTKVIITLKIAKG